MSKKLKVLDLFAGCGGMSLGFQKAGFEICAAFENWQPAIETYRKNFPNHETIDIDIRELEKSSEDLSKYKPDMIIGGPPCQDFSSAGKRDESLGRADLTVVFARIISRLNVEMFVMENVERATKSNAYEKSKRIFARSGYGLTEIVLDASLCGVPQKRKRLFLIGDKNSSNDSLKPYLIRNLASKRMSVRDFLGNDLDVEHYYRHPRTYQRRGVFSIDEPSPTIRGVNRPIPKTYKSHPGDTELVENGVRALTTKERSLLQTFPRKFEFIGNKSQVEQMVGNAVPVNLAKFVAKAILEYRKSGQTLRRVEIKEPVQKSLF